MTLVQTSEIRVGTAGWTVPKSCAGDFPSDGSHLKRYAQRFPAVEINSCFYRPHKPETYARWAASVPDGFKFSLKVPKQITHVQRLVVGCELPQFLTDIKQLGSKLGPVLVQLPPRLAFDPALAGGFFTCLRDHFDGDVVCEPRHVTWFDEGGDEFLREMKVARVAADPALVPEAAEPGGWKELVYYRLHGSPKMYYDAYSADYLNRLIMNIEEQRAESRIWCIFDNTALGAAPANALSVLKRFME